MTFKFAGNSLDEKEVVEVLKQCEAVVKNRIALREVVERLEERLNLRPREEIKDLYVISDDFRRLLKQKEPDNEIYPTSYNSIADRA